MNIFKKIIKVYKNFKQKRNFKKQEKEYKKFFQNTTSTNSIDELNMFSDYEFNEKQELDNRNHLYSTILSLYVNEYQKNQIKTYENKWRFCNIMLISFVLFLILLVVMSVIVFLFFSNKKYVVLISFATSLIGILSTLSIMPQIIAKYLFNPKEDEYIAKLVTDMQAHDNRTKEIIMQRESKND